jgi:hypothetical protein
MFRATSIGMTSKAHHIFGSIEIRAFHLSLKRYCLAFKRSPFAIVHEGIYLGQFVFKSCFWYSTSTAISVQFGVDACWTESIVILNSTVLL